jgi:hypothetical protein
MSRFGHAARSGSTRPTVSPRGVFIIARKKETLLRRCQPRDDALPGVPALDVVTDCPTLLALPAIQQRVGFAEIERLDLTGGTDSNEPTAEFPQASSPNGAEPSELTA